MALEVNNLKTYDDTGRKSSSGNRPVSEDLAAKKSRRSRSDEVTDYGGDSSQLVTSKRFSQPSSLSGNNPTKSPQIIEQD